MKITAFMGSIHGAWLNSAKPSDFEGHVFLSRDLEDETFRDSALKALNEADLTLFYDSGEPSMAFVKDALANLEPGRRFIQLSWEPSQWGGTEEPWVNAQAQRYLTQGGPQNPSRLWAFLKALAEGSPHEAPEPLILPAWGLYHPQAPQPAYEELKDFLAWADARPTNASLNHGAVGIIFHRIYWSVGQTAIEDRIIEALEAEGLKVLPFFVDWSEDPSQGQEALAKLEKAFDGSHGPKIDVIVKLVSTLSSPGQGHEKAELFEDSPARWSVRLFKKLNVPVLQPLVSWSQNIEQWEKDPLGLGRESAWSMAMSEFEGAIEPFFVGGTLRQGLPTGTPAPRQPHWERIQRLAQRARSWANLAHTPPKDRKVAFILHNNPCGSVEGTIGVAAGLDSAQSLVKLAQAMKEVGYSVDVPQSGPELLKEILEKKAISEFRWTAAPEIVARGGALALIDPEGYNRYFASFPEKVKEEIIKTWGHPPGETIDEVPPAMLHEGRIIVAGLKLGPNAVVLPQPKRGCAGSRCDGRVCRILQDPLIAPPHQYLATYRWLQDPQGFGAHIIIHLGTLGNLEYLPGKSAGLSESCSPDLALYQSPNLYVYDSWDTGPGLTAKRRSYAVLDDHLPPAMRLAQTPKALMELEELMSQSQKNPEDPDKTAVTREAIREKILEAKLENTLGPLDGDFGELAIRIRRFLGLVSGSLVEDGLHVLGDIPEGERLTSLVAAILLFESGDSPGLRSLLAKEAGLDLLALLEDPSALTPQGATNTRILEDFDNKGTKIVSAIIAGGALEAIERELGGQSASPETWTALIYRAQNILARVKACREILTALTALNAGYVEPGPSGNLSRGQEEALPTGRNFFAHDPRHLPTQRAYKIGQQLAEATIKKHLEDEGRFPESVAFFWISADLLQ
ncbi:MAG: cobaltochelatase subunit CobN, partial [Deltaproteobacteria bacterium]|nr:cobaltochelatase subunit CobN [Deltaproteobacteria bacterium]